MVHRSRGSIHAVLLAAILLLAGCSALPVTDQPTPTAQPTVENFSYPSGWSQTGITDLTAAMRAHDEAVENVSRKSRLVITNEDYNRTVVRTVDTDAHTAAVRFVDTEFGSDIHAYYSTEGVYEYDRTTGELNQSPDANWTQSRVASHEGMRRPLSNLEVNATETITVEGTRFVRYTVTGIKKPNSVPANTATGHVTVAEEGYIAEYNITRGNEEFTRQTKYDVSEFGNTTVTRPAWMPEK